MNVNAHRSFGSLVKAIVALALLMASTAVTAEVRDANEYFFDQKMGDFHAELETAKQEGKRGILLMFELDDCPFCHRMKQTILNQSEVQDYFRRHFLIFAVDAKGDTPMVDFKGRHTTEKVFAAEQRVRATPVFVFFDLEGKPVARFTGAAKDLREFMLLGRYVAEGAYQDKQLNFSRYKQKMQAAQ